MGADVTRAMQFSAAASGSVGTIDIALSHVTGAGDADLSLYEDNRGAFGTWRILPASQYTTSGNAVATISGITGISLSAGSSHWLSAVADKDTRDMWNDNTVGATERPR